MLCLKGRLRDVVKGEKNLPNICSKLTTKKKKTEIAKKEADKNKGKYNQKKKKKTQTKRKLQLEVRQLHFSLANSQFV